MSWLELRVPPLLVAALFALVMWLLARLLPTAAWPQVATQVLGVMLALFGGAVSLAGVVAFRRARTTVDPMHPEAASRIVRDGIYRYSRNPMYLGFAVALAGWAVFLASLPALLTLPAFVVWIDRFQIRPEERLLARRFASEFEAYRHAVRRWL